MIAEETEDLQDHLALAPDPWDPRDDQGHRASEDHRARGESQGRPDRLDPSAPPEDADPREFPETAEHLEDLDPLDLQVNAPNLKAKTQTCNFTHPKL